MANPIYLRNEDRHLFYVISLSLYIFYFGKLYIERGSCTFICMYIYRERERERQSVLAQGVTCERRVSMAYYIGCLPLLENGSGHPHIVRKWR